MRLTARVPEKRTVGTIVATQSELIPCPGRSSVRSLEAIVYPYTGRHALGTVCKGALGYHKRTNGQQWVCQRVRTPCL